MTGKKRFPRGFFAGILHKKNGRTARALAMCLAAAVFLACLPSRAVFADPVTEGDQTQAPEMTEEEKQAQYEAIIAQYNLQQAQIQQQIDAVQQEKAATQGELSSAEGTVSSLTGQQDAVAGEMDLTNESIAQNMASIQILMEDIENLQTQIDIKQEEYDEAKADEARQYEAMKQRIRFMYSRGERNYVELLLQASSYSDYLNKADYIEKLNEYDRRLLDEYQETQRRIAEIQEELESEKAELEESQRGLEEEQQDLRVKFGALQVEYNDFADRIVAAQSQASALRGQIADENARISALQAEKAQAAAAMQAAQAQAAAAKAAAQPAAVPTVTTPAATAAPVTTTKPAAGFVSSSGGSAAGRSVVAYAKQFIGRPYVFGGTSLTNGCDCSGFTMLVYGHFGISLAHQDAKQRNVGTPVASLSEAQPGDLICYAGHVAIYCGDNTVVHASSSAPYPRGGIKLTSPANYRSIICIRRLVN